MNGIDISGWQPDINIAAVPADFVIIKATEGTSFVSDSFTKQINAAEKAGRLLGVYHYINGAGVDGEMQHFYNTIKPWIGKAIICLDWEDVGNRRWGDTAYLKQCIEKIKALTNKTIVLYSSQAYFPWKVSNETGCKVWMAQYANMNPTGYQNNPWNEGAYTCLIRQYSSRGKLSGYSGYLDLNKAYCTRDEWNKLAGGGNTVKPTPTNPSKPSTGSAIAVDGIWGKDTTRKLQQVLGGTVSGIVCCQDRTAFNKCNGGGLLTSTFQFGSGGSACIRGIQKKVGVTVDGYIGVNTIKALQKYLGTPVDGKVSNPSPMVKALQKKLNSGKL